jgi:hypothetical protein
MKNTFLLLISVFFCALLHAQKIQNKWTPTVGLSSDIIPTYNIVGTDTGYSNNFSIAPSFSIRNTAGWGINYSPKFLSGTSGPLIFMHVVTVGVEQYDRKTLDYTFNYNHYFFSGNKSVPYTPLSNEISGSLTWKKMWVNPIVEAGVGFGNDTSGGKNSLVNDIAVVLGAGHSFELYADQNLNMVFKPALLLNLGTNDYFSFLSISNYNGHGKNSLKFLKNGHQNNSGGNGNKNKSSGSPFSVSNIEARFEASAEWGNWTLRPDASLYLPVGKYAGTGVYGYWQIAVTYSFY